MKILGLQVQNFKRLKAINIHPQGNMVVLSGENGQGKSSAIDSIWATLGGGDAKKEIPMPIRAGEKRAEVRIDLGPVIVTRTWTSNDQTYLKIDGKEGAMKSPQAQLDQWVSDLTFDPLAFSRQDPAEQRRILMKVSNVSMQDIEQIDRQKSDYYNERTIINREIKNLEGQLSSLPHVENPPEKEVDVNDVHQKLLDLKTKNAEYIRDKEEFEELGKQMEKLRNRRNDLLAQWKAYDYKTMQKQEEDLSNYAWNVDGENKKFRDYTERMRVETLLMERRAKSQEMTDLIDFSDKQKIEFLSQAKMPIDGLSIDEEGVYFNGTPFKQLSSAEQLRIATAIAMSKNPELRVLLIKEGSLLDDKSMELLHALAVKHDYQIWIEVVDSSKEKGIVIENGEVVRTNPSS